MVSRPMSRAAKAITWLEVVGYICIAFVVLPFVVIWVQAEMQDAREEAMQAQDIQQQLEMQDEQIKELGTQLRSIAREVVTTK